MFPEILQTETPAPWYKTIVDLWPLAAGLAGLIGAIVAGILGVRYYEKAGIDKTNEKAVNSLKELVAARDQEISDRDETIAELKADCTGKDKAFAALESEYKAIAGIVLAELISWAARYDSHLADMHLRDSEIRVLKLQIEAMERHSIDQHTSKS